VRASELERAVSNLDTKCDIIERTNASARPTKQQMDTLIAMARKVVTEYYAGQRKAEES
jgi:predicted RecB family endonuclease